MGTVVPFRLRDHEPEFTVVLARITLKGITKYMVRVLRGDELVTDDVFFPNHIEAAENALKDAKTMATIHKQAIAVHNRITGHNTEIRA